MDEHLKDSLGLAVITLTNPTFARQIARTIIRTDPRVAEDVRQRLLGEAGTA